MPKRHPVRTVSLSVSNDETGVYGYVSVHRVEGSHKMYHAVNPAELDVLFKRGRTMQTLLVASKICKELGHEEQIHRYSVDSLDYDATCTRCGTYIMGQL